MHTDIDDYEVIEIRVNDHNEMCCDYGVFANSEADPTRRIEPLVLVSKSFLREMLLYGPQEGGWTGSTCSADIHEHGRITVTLDYEQRQWVWEVFEGAWWDDTECDVCVGRWKD